METVVARASSEAWHARDIRSREACEVARREQSPGRFSKIEDVVQRGVIGDLGENEPLTESKLAPLEAGAGLPPSIPPGMRAVSVKVNEVVGVAGFVVPGTRVDVMVTLTSRQQQQTARRAWSSATHRC